MSKKTLSIREIRRINLDKFNFEEIEKLDPSLNNTNQKVIFDQEIKFRIRFIEPDDSTHLLDEPEHIKVKLFCCLNEEDEEYFRIELTSNNDIFFFYAHIADKESFEVIKEDQRLNCSFDSYPNLCVKLLRETITKGSKFWAEFTIHYDGSGRLEIKRQASIKVFSVLSIDFSPMPYDMVKHKITYRFGALNSKITMMQDRIFDIYKVLGKKNPSLLLTIQKKVK